MKVWKAMLGAFAAAVLLISGLKAIENWKEGKADAERPAIHMDVNDSTQAELARVKMQRDSLAALWDASKTMGGRPVAGVKIVVRPETVYVDRQEVVTVNTPDSARYGTLTDTTPGGYVVKIEAEAPKYPAALKLGYTLTTPEFSPEVGFVKRPEGYFAVVSWAGVNFEVKNAFFTPPKERPLTVLVGADLLGSPSDNIAGAKLSLSGYGAVKYATPKWDYLLKAGHNGSPFVGLGVQKRVW